MSIKATDAIALQILPLCSVTFKFCATNRSFIFCSHLKCDQLKMLVADHLDDLHYLHDILCLGIEKLNTILTDHLSNKLLIPLYVYSLPTDELDAEVR